MPLLAFILVMLSGTAYAHSWYENQCCNETHCHPVADGVVRNTKDGVSVTGYGMLSYSDPRLRWSRDNQDHICEMKESAKLLCIYRKYQGI